MEDLHCRSYFEGRTRSKPGGTKPRASSVRRVPRAFRRGCRGAGGPGSVTTMARLSLEEERYVQSSSFCQPDPKFTMFMLNIFLFSF